VAFSQIFFCPVNGDCVEGFLIRFVEIDENLFYVRKDQVLVSVNRLCQFEAGPILVYYRIYT